MPTLPNLTVNSFAMPPSPLFLSTAELQPLRKLRSQFSRDYVQTLVTEIDRPHDQEIKIRLWYWYYCFQKQKALFLRYNSSRVDLYARTKDLWISSSCGDSYEIQAYHMTIKAQCYDLWLTIHIILYWEFRPISTQKLNQDHHQGWYFECKIRHQRPPCGTQINQDFLICMCLWNFSNPIRVHTWTIPIMQLSVPHWKFKKILYQEKRWLRICRTHHALP